MGDGGVGKIPELIPRLVGGGKGGLLGKLPGIPDLLEKIVDGLVGGIDGDGGDGLGSFGKIIGDIGKKIIGGLFGRFSADSAPEPGVAAAAAADAYYDPPL